MPSKKLTTAEIQKMAGRPGAVIDGRVIHADYSTSLIDPEIALVVYGDPSPQGSKKHIGRGRLVEASKSLPAWRKAVREEAKKAVLHKGDDWSGPIDEPVLIEVVFTFPHSAASAKRGDVYFRNAPDLDKLQRAIGDAISPTPLKAGTGKGLSTADAEKLKEQMRKDAKEFTILENDSCIVAWQAKKVYVDSTSDALHYPGVSIEVWRLSSLHAAKKALEVEESDFED